MPKKQINRTKHKVVWTKPIYILRSMILEDTVFGVYDDKNLAEAELAKDPDLYMEESGLNNDYIIVDED